MGFMTIHRNTIRLKRTVTAHLINLEMGIITKKLNINNYEDFEIGNL